MNKISFPSSGLSAKPLLQAFQGEVLRCPPIWLMRQAGRYLPEYREVRQKAGSFLNLCYSPELAAEVTLQPIRRFGFDAAILFSDILVVPDALGQKVEFVEGEGPRLAAIENLDDIHRLTSERSCGKFEKVFEAVRLIKAKLPDQVALIGFCGAPWTVATYMVGGKGSSDQAITRLFAYRNERAFSELITLLVDCSVDYLLGQVRAGVEVLQIFDSWSGNLPDDQFERWVVEPTKKIVARIKAKHKTLPIIGFPRAAGPQTRRYVQETGVDGVGCDTSLPLDFIAGELQERATVQGNLDPLLLIAGGEKLDRRVRDILAKLSQGPFIFNLGHGILPETNVENVERLIRLVRERNYQT